MQKVILDESLLTSIIIQSFKNTKDFEIFVNDIIKQVKILNPSINSRSKEFNIIVSTFYKWNIFNVRNSVKDIANGFACSRITVYNRINEITKSSY